MSTGSLARRYARALFSIGLEQGKYEPLGNEVADIAKAMQDSPELMAVLTSPIFKRSQRGNVLDKLMSRLGCSRVTRNFFHLLLDRERIAVVPDISRALSAMIDEKMGRVKAVVTSAQPLNHMQVQQLKRSLERASGKQVELEQVHDPSLLGGVVAELGDVRYDGSLRTHLERMRDGLVH
jgi:F-type H+-transporting ATPase subunit delta